MKTALPGLKVEYSTDNGRTWSEVTKETKVDGAIILRTRYAPHVLNQVGPYALTVLHVYQINLRTQTEVLVNLKGRSRDLTLRRCTVNGGATQERLGFIFESRFHFVNAQI